MNYSFIIRESCELSTFFDLPNQISVPNGLGFRPLKECAVLENTAFGMRVMPESAKSFYLSFPSTSQMTDCS